MSEDPAIEIPEELPMMVLPATLFPHCLMPLFIFEPRYREMLKRVLETDRFFCIAHCDPNDDSEENDRRLSPISTAGIVRACVTHDDGTSHLLLLGTQRIRLGEFHQVAPYRIASVTPSPSEMETPELATQLAADAIKMISEFSEAESPMSEQVHAHLKSLDDPSAVADVIAHNFVTDPRQRQTLLEAIEVSERLHRLTQFLRARLTDPSS